MRSLSLLACLIFSSVAYAQSGSSPVYVVGGKSTLGVTSFAPPRAYPLTSTGNPRFLTTADFNRDGYQDIAVALSNDGTVSVWLNDGPPGTFTYKGTFAADAAGVRGLTSGDFNGDGIPDIAVANTSTGKVAVLIGIGDGTFKPHKDFTGITGAYSISAGRLAAQSVLSLAVSSQSTNAVAVLPGIGDGGFGTAVTFAADAGTFTSRSLSFVDMNDDGFQDIVAADNGTVGVFVDTWLGLVDGGFAPAQAQGFQPTGTGHGAEFVATLDCNADAIADLAVVGGSSSMFAIPGVRSQNGVDIIGFSDPTAVVWRDANQTGYSQVAIGDVNGDGLPDVVGITNDTGGNYNGPVLFLNDGKCGLGPPVFLPITAAYVDGGFAAGTVSFGVTVADFNNDGVSDIAAVTQNGTNQLIVWVSRGAPPQVWIGNVPTVDVASLPVPLSARSMAPPAVLTFGGSVVQSIVFPPLTCVNILCNAPSEFFTLGADAGLTPATGNEVAQHSTTGFGWERDICLSSPATTQGDYNAELTLRLVSAADGGVCKVSKYNRN